MYLTQNDFFGRAPPTLESFQKFWMEDIAVIISDGVRVFCVKDFSCFSRPVLKSLMILPKYLKCLDENIKHRNKVLILFCEISDP